MTTSIRFRPILWFLVLCSLVAPPLEASQVRPVNLEQMTERAARIFTGRCTDTTVMLDPQLGREITVATFDVDRVVKGEVGSTITLRMMGGERGDGSGAAGLPRFRPGDEVILFLYAESAVGLSSPVGLGQGRFTVFTDKAGYRIAVNDFTNNNLLHGLTPQARTRLGPALDVWKERKDLAAGALLEMVESLIEP